MKTAYIVTTELKTPWWKRLLRFLYLVKPRYTFELTFMLAEFSKGEILDSGGQKLKVVGKIKPCKAL